VTYFRGTAHHELVGGRQAGAAAEADAAPRQPAVSRAAISVLALRVRAPLRAVHGVVPRLDPLTMHVAVVRAAKTVKRCWDHCSLSARGTDLTADRGRLVATACLREVVVSSCNPCISTAVRSWQRADPNPETWREGHLHAGGPLTLR